MQEVHRQLGPLADRVAKIANHIERLYNSNGGPPGFLQTARKEDQGRFDMIFNILDEHKSDIQPIKDFMRDHEIREKDRDRRFDRRMAKWMLLFAALGTLFLIFDHRDIIGRSLLAVPVAHSQLAPQDAGSTIPHHY